MDAVDSPCWVRVEGESLPGRVSRWRRDPGGWRAFVTYSRAEDGALLRYAHWVTAAELSPREEDCPATSHE